jgi:glycerate kinase
VFGPQKGATPEIVKELDAALERYADVLERFVGRSVRDVPGAGAAGGLGAGLLAFLDARLVSGAMLVLDAVGFERHLDGAALVITGEGRIDGQSVYGKLTQAVTVAARRRGVPVVAVAGMVGDGADAMRDAGIEAIETLAATAAERPAAMRDPLPRIQAAAARLVRARAQVG